MARGYGRRPMMTIVVVVLAFGIAVLGWSAWMGIGRDTVQDGVSLQPAGTASDDLAKARQMRMLFGHQSIGANIISGIDSLYADAQQPKLKIVESSQRVDDRGPFLQHALIGNNGDPVGKIDAFAAILDGGAAETVEVAMMKLCYIDFVADTDVDALFDNYTKTLDALETKYPNVIFLHATAPLTIEPTLTTVMKSTAKAWLRGRLYSPPENQVRERYNARIREKYGDTGRLLDIAAWEALRSDGTLTAKASGGGTFLSLNPVLASDDAHLNDQGAKQLAGAFLHLIATQKQR